MKSSRISAVSYTHLDVYKRQILDSMGFSALETWGGATIDAGLRFLKVWPLSLIHI